MTDVITIGKKDLENDYQHLDQTYYTPHGRVTVMDVSQDLRERKWHLTVDAMITIDITHEALKAFSNENFQIAFKMEVVKRLKELSEEFMNSSSVGSDGGIFIPKEMN